VEIIVQRTDTDSGLELICPCCRTANAVEERDAASRVNELTDATLDDQGALHIRR
jgi:hypothetical protein